MKIYRVIKSILLSLFIIMLFVCTLIPLVETKGYSTETKLYLLDVLSTNESFYGILGLIILFVAPMLLIVENKIIKLVGAACSIACFVVAENLMVTVMKNTSSSVSHGGLVFWFVVETLIFALALADCYFAFIHPMVSSMLKKDNDGSIKKRLQDNKELLDEGLITQEEFETRREKILKGE